MEEEEGSKKKLRLLTFKNENVLRIIYKSKLTKKKKKRICEGLEAVYAFLFPYFRSFPETKINSCTWKNFYSQFQNFNDDDDDDDCENDHDNNN